MCVPAAAPFLDDDRTLLVDLDRIVGNEMGIIMQDKQAGVSYRRPYQRNVVEHILCLVESSRGVYIAAEGCADALEPFEETLAREILGSVEAHVLEEVGETVLVRSFLDGTHVGCEVEFGTVGRFVIVPDVIGEPVIQGSLADCRVVWKLWHLRAGNEG